MFNDTSIYTAVAATSVGMMAHDSTVVADTVKINLPPVCYEIAQMKEEDIPEILRIRKSLNCCIVDSNLRTHFKSNPEGFIVVKTEKGEIIGTCCKVKNHDSLYFGGLLWVHEKYRRSGISRKIVEILHDNENTVAANVVTSNTTKFRALFPILETNFTILFYRNESPVSPNVLPGVIPHGVTIEPYQGFHFSLIAKYDFAVVGYKRDILELSFKEKGSKTFVAVQNGLCVGYGSIKTTCKGLGIVGPLYTDDPQVADVILKELVVSLPGVTGFMAVSPSNNMKSKRMFTRLGCYLAYESHRLYRKERLNVDTDKVYSLFDPYFQPF